MEQIRGKYIFLGGGGAIKTEILYGKSTAKDGRCSKMQLKFSVD